MIRILIVDDSETETVILRKIFESAPDMRVVGHARNGEEAIKLTEILKPDLITMDIQMPVMDGLDATRAIMATHPTPIVVISSKLNDLTLNPTFTALEAGALTVIEKPKNIFSSHFEHTHKRMLDMIRTMAEVKPITHHLYNKKKLQPTPSLPIAPLLNLHHAEKYYRLLAIGSSIGGPQVLKTIFKDLPLTFPVPIVIVQHMTPEFIDDFTTWLNAYTKLQVKLAEDNEILVPGKIYFAPDYKHLTITNKAHQLKAQLINSPPIAGFCPSITVMMNSVASTCHNQAVGLLLTGMGHDGADGMLALKKAGSHTLIQDEKSCVVFGMASVALSMNAVDNIVELDKITEYLLKAFSPLSNSR